jgi:hypothetical protein
MESYPTPGSVVAGRYRIEAILGEGGMGAVFRATELATNDAVALKFMAPEMRRRPGMASRFANEASAAAKIASEHVVAIRGVEATEDGTPFIVMELLEGTDLDRIVETEAPLETPRAIHFALQILRALQVAHGAGVVHRDLKPSNCLVVVREGDPDYLKLIDFGITKILGDDSGLTKTSTTLGTPAYMSPEQAKSAKAADARSDLYAVGVILYELLSKKRPFEGESNNELVIKICTEPPIPLGTVRPDLDRKLASAVEHALVKIPHGRYPNAQSFAEALRPFADARSNDVLARIVANAPPTPQARQGGTAVIVARPNVSPEPDREVVKTAVLEDGFAPAHVVIAPFDVDGGAAVAPGRPQEKTMVGDVGPMNFGPVVPAGTPAPISPVPYIVGAPVPPGPYSEAEGEGGGNGGLIALLAALAIGLIGTGVYFAFFRSTVAPPAPTTTSPAGPAKGDDDEQDPVKKPKHHDPSAPATTEEPVVVIPPPKSATAAPGTTTAPKPPATKPPTTTTAPPTTTVPPTKPSTTIIIPPWFIGKPPPTSTTTAPPPPPTTTTPPPPPPPPTTTLPPLITATPPPATTTAPTATGKKPKFGG